LRRLSDCELAVASVQTGNNYSIRDANPWRFSAAGYEPGTWGWLQSVFPGSDLRLFRGRPLSHDSDNLKIA
jgi:hypothetical protein